MQWYKIGSISNITSFLGNSENHLRWLVVRLSKWSWSLKEFKMSISERKISYFTYMFYCITQQIIFTTYSSCVNRPIIRYWSPWRWTLFWPFSYWWRWSWGSDIINFLFAAGQSRNNRTLKGRCEKRLDNRRIIGSIDITFPISAQLNLTQPSWQPVMLCTQLSIWSKC